MEPDCPQCIELLETYDAVTATHTDLERKLQLAALEYNSITL
jgi:hypothetical protein